MSVLTDAIRRLQPKNLVPYRPKRWKGQAAYQKKRRQANLTTIKAQEADKRRTRKKQVIALLGGQCRDCGLIETEHIEVFEFDHVRGVKIKEIGKLFQGSWKTLASELKKCDLVCANCHHKRTAHRREINGCELPKISGGRF